MSVTPNPSFQTMTEPDWKARAEKAERQNAVLREALGEAEWCLVMLPEAMVEPVERYRRAKRLLADALAAGQEGTAL